MNPDDIHDQATPSSPGSLPAATMSPPDSTVEGGGGSAPERSPVGTADVPARMAVEFATFLSSSVIDEVIIACRRDLDGVSPGMLPELLERLARQCLADRVGAGGPGVRSADAPEGRSLRPVRAKVRTLGALPSTGGHRAVTSSRS